MFNISLLILQPEQLKRMRPVRVMDMYDGISDQFHPDGLFSTLTFGKVGDEMRKTQFSYIDLKVPVIHPAIWRALGELKSLYTEVLSGKAYAVFNTATKDLDRVDASVGQTGYYFFMQQLPKLKFEERKSLDRQDNIKLVYKWRNSCLIDKLVVIPAGWRDVEIENGRPVQDEINDFYRQMLAVANTVVAGANNDTPIMDTTRFSIQKIFNGLYENIMARLDGKHRLVMGRVASRRIFNGTRNVITAQFTDIGYLGGQEETNANNTYAGIYQTAIAYLQKSIYAIKTKYLPNIVVSHREPARLVNMKTLESEEVKLPAKTYNQLLTNEGIESLIHLFGLAGNSDAPTVNVAESVQNKPFIIEGHYVALIYKGDDGSFKVFYDIKELPSNFDKTKVSPITFTEFMYCSLYDTLNNSVAYVTRYPITGVGSIYPSLMSLQSTIQYERRYELVVGWDDDSHDPKYKATRFPMSTSPLYQSMSPNASKMKGLTGDYDGDMCSLDGLTTDEAIAEAKAFMNSKKGYLGTNGKLLSSAGNDVSDLLFFNLTTPIA